jgi:hypothetical protein
MSQDFICSGAPKKLKHEDIFEDKEFRFPYMDDPYDGAEDQARRAKWCGCALCACVHVFRVCFAHVCGAVYVVFCVVRISLCVCVSVQVCRYIVCACVQ